MQMRILEWKRGLLTTVIEKSRLILKYSSVDEFNQLSIGDLKKDDINIQVKPFMFKMGDSVSYHEPHCANYRLFHLMQTDNPFAIKIDSVDTAALAEIEESKSGSDNSASFDHYEDALSVASVKIANNHRRNSAGMMLSKI